MAGRAYDRTIELQRFTAGEDEYGDPTQAWSTLATVPARQRVARGSERLANAEIAATAPVVFYVPWAPQLADLNAKDRVLSEGKVHDIISAIEVGRRREIEVAATRAGD